jgi:hypothetical protein
MMGQALDMKDLIDQHMVTGAEADAVRARMRQKLATRTTAEWESFFAPLDVMVPAT